MQRVKRSTAVAVLPAAPAGGVPGFFTGGDPVGGVPATVPGYEWFNAVQEEIVHVITQAGIALNGVDNTQLYTAIRSLITAASHEIVIEGAVFEASISNGDVVRWDAGNNRFDEAIADGTANNRAVGIANVTASKVHCFGETPALFVGLTPGSRYYLDAVTPGAVTTVMPADPVFIGIAKSATVMFLDIDFGFQVASQAEAEAGVDNSKVMTPLRVKQAIQAIPYTKALVNFDGRPRAGVAYTRAGTTVTVTLNAHGFSTGDLINVQAATDGAINVNAAQITVTGANTFTFQTAATGANGTLTVATRTRSFFNIASVVRNGTGDYTLNFSAALPSSEYCTFGAPTFSDLTGNNTAGVFNLHVTVANSFTLKTANSLRFLANNNDSDVSIDAFNFCVEIK